MSYEALSIDTNKPLQKSADTDGRGHERGRQNVRVRTSLVMSVITKLRLSGHVRFHVIVTKSVIFENAWYVTTQRSLNTLY